MPRPAILVARCCTRWRVRWAVKEASEAIRQLPSKQHQASYLGPDLVRHKAPVTIAAREDPEAWLAARRAEIKNEDWTPRKARKPVTFGEHAERWLKAVQRRLIDFNPCHIRGAGNSKRVKRIKPATLPELAARLR